MENVKNRHRIRIKVIAIVVVCLFTINTISWAYPGGRISSHNSTLQVQSIFKPIMDVTGERDDLQLRFETAIIAKMIAREDDIPCQNINAQLNDWYDRANKEIGKWYTWIGNSNMNPFYNKKRRLHVESAVPEKRGDEVVVKVSVFDGPGKGEEFEIHSSCKTLKDIQYDPGKIKIVPVHKGEKKKPAVEPAEDGRRPSRVHVETITPSSGFVDDNGNIKYSVVKYIGEHETLEHARKAALSSDEDFCCAKIRREPTLMELRRLVKAGIREVSLAKTEDGWFLTKGTSVGVFMPFPVWEFRLHSHSKRNFREMGIVREKYPQPNPFEEETARNNGKIEYVLSDKGLCVFGGQLDKPVLATWKELSSVDLPLTELEKYFIEKAKPAPEPVKPAAEPVEDDADWSDKDRPSSTDAQIKGIATIAGLIIGACFGFPGLGLGIGLFIELLIGFRSTFVKLWHKWNEIRCSLKYLQREVAHSAIVLNVDQIKNRQIPAIQRLKLSRKGRFVLAIFYIFLRILVFLVGAYRVLPKDPGKIWAEMLADYDGSFTVISQKDQGIYHPEKFMKLFKGSPEDLKKVKIEGEEGVPLIGGYSGPVFNHHGQTKINKKGEKVHVVGDVPVCEVVNALAETFGIEKILLYSCNPEDGGLGGKVNIPVIYPHSIVGSKVIPSLLAPTRAVATGWSVCLPSGEEIPYRKYLLETPAKNEGEKYAQSLAKEEVQKEHIFIPHRSLTSAIWSWIIGLILTNANVTCGTICESEHEGSVEALNEQLKRQFEGFKGVLGIQEDRDLTEKEADKALVRREAAKSGRWLKRLRASIREMAGIPDDISIFFGVPEGGTELFWVNGKWGAGHFNRKGSRIHISLPFVQKSGVKAGALVAKHELAHIQRGVHEEIPGYLVGILGLARREDAIHKRRESGRTAKKGNLGKALLSDLSDDAQIRLAGALGIGDGKRRLSKRARKWLSRRARVAEKENIFEMLRSTKKQASKRFTGARYVVKLFLLKAKRLLAWIAGALRRKSAAKPTSKTSAPKNDSARKHKRRGNPGFLRIGIGAIILAIVMLFAPAKSAQAQTEEYITTDFVVGTEVDGTRYSEHEVGSDRYTNTRNELDGTVRTYNYDASWNLTEEMVYHPDGTLERTDHAQGPTPVALTPGWKEYWRGGNLPWVNYGFDVGLGANGESHEGYSSPVGRVYLYEKLKPWKGGYVRVFLFCDLRSGINFDASGNPIDFTAHVYEDINALVEAADVLGIKLMLVFFDYMVADGVSDEGGYPVGEHPDLITDPGKQAALLALMTDLVRANAGKSAIVAWDVMNEPSESVKHTGITTAQMQSFLGAAVNIVRNEDPTTSVTIGAKNWDEAQNWSGLNQHFSSFHFYSHMSPDFSLTDTVSGKYTEIEPGYYSFKMKTARANGATGAFFWKDDYWYTITNSEAHDILIWDESTEVVVPPAPDYSSGGGCSASKGAGPSAAWILLPWMGLAVLILRARRRARERAEEEKRRERLEETGLAARYPEIKERGYELIGIDEAPEKFDELKRLTGAGFIARHPRVYSPLQDNNLGFHFANTVRSEVYKCAHIFRSLGHDEMRIVVIGGGTVIDAKTAFHAAERLKRVHVDAIDINPYAVENMQYNLELAGGRCQTSIHPRLVEEGEEFADLEGPYDVIIFQAPKLGIFKEEAERTKKSIVMDVEAFKSVMKRAVEKLSPDGLILVRMNKRDYEMRSKLLPAGTECTIADMFPWHDEGADHIFVRITRQFVEEPPSTEPPKAGSMSGGPSPRDYPQYLDKPASWWAQLIIDNMPNMGVRDSVLLFLQDKAPDKWEEVGIILRFENYLYPLRRELREAEERLNKPWAGVTIPPKAIRDIQKRSHDSARRALYEAEEHVAAIRGLMKSGTVEEFRKALREVEGGALRELPHETNIILEAMENEIRKLSEEMNLPDLVFNREEMLVIPGSSWLKELFGINEATTGASIVRIADKFIILVFEQNIQNTGNLVHMLLHETIHKVFSRGRQIVQTERPAEYDLRRILGEAMTEKLTMDVISKVFSGNDDVRNALLSDMAKDPDPLIGTFINFLADDESDLGQLFFKETIRKATENVAPKNTIYKDERNFLEGLVNLAGIDAVVKFLAEGNSSDLRNALGNNWDGLARIARVAAASFGAHRSMPQGDPPRLSIYRVGVYAMERAMRNPEASELILEGGRVLLGMMEGSFEYMISPDFKERRFECITKDKKLFARCLLHSGRRTIDKIGSEIKNVSMPYIDMAFRKYLFEEMESQPDYIFASVRAEATETKLSSRGMRKRAARIKRSCNQSVNLMEDVKPVLARAVPASKEKEELVPVDIEVDLSLITRKNMEEYADIWASLILSCAENKNVNFHFGLPDYKGSENVPAGISRDMANAPTWDDLKDVLKGKIASKAPLFCDGLKVEEFFQDRINTEIKPEAIRVPIYSKTRLEWMRKNGIPLKADQYPVALDEFTTVMNNRVALRNFEAALAIGLCKAALVIAKRRGGGELDELKSKIIEKLKNLYKIFKVRSPKFTINEDTLSLMLSSCSETRMDLAIYHALPPILRMPIDDLPEQIRTASLYLQSA